MLDGTSTETAVVIHEKSHFKGVAAEYAWLSKNYPGYKIISQAVYNFNGIPYDRIDFKTAEGETKQMHFEISSFFGKFIF